jgi:hypothetical protein
MRCVVLAAAMLAPNAARAEPAARTLGLELSPPE